MDRLTRAMRCADHLQEGVSAALATLTAVFAADLFASLPSNPDEAALQNHGMALLSMLESHLRRVQSEVDNIAAAPAEVR